MTQSPHITFKTKLIMNEMAMLAGRGSDPNADEKAIVDILQRIHNHPNAKERSRYIDHPQGAHQYAQKHMLTGNDEYDRGTRTAAAAAQAILNHSSKRHGSIKDIFKKRNAVIARSGITAAKVTPEYQKLGGKNATSRADITVSSADGKSKHTFSVKKNDAQVASAESGELRSLGHAATDSYTTHEPTRRDIKSRIDAIAAIQKKSESVKNDDEYRKHAKTANRILQRLRADHPEWEHHIGREAATGHAKFGKDQEGSADNMLSYNEKSGEAKIWKSESKGSPYSKLKMEVRAGKGRKGKRDPNAPAGVDLRKRRQIALRVEPGK